MKVLRFCAVYRQVDTGRVRLEIRTARNIFTASKQLPKWIYPNGMKMQRQGGIRFYDPKDKTT